MDFLDKIILNNTGRQYLIAVILFIALFVFFRIFRRIVIQKINILTKNTKNKFDDLIVENLEGISKFFYWFVSLFIALQTLNLPIWLENVLKQAIVIFIVWEVILIAKKTVKYFSKVFVARSDQGKKAVYHIVEIFIIWSIYIIAGLFLLAHFGIDITAIVAGLGIGGIAIGFALKEILADLFSYFTILLDRPIEEGDYIVVGDKAGTVKKIGIKTTRLVGTDGREVIVSNNAISSGLIDNSKRREYRRVKFVLGVAYDTPMEKLKKIKTAIEKIVTIEEKAKFLRSHFNSFGDSALEFTIDYKLFTTGYDEYADAKEKINFGILEFCEKNNIEIAYPSMTIYTKK